ncbi:hypothetical protein GCK32_006594 [Trichostrongylus colubriformis]|uniref:Uncharacterized protein n=1 Tax=Trichostrongylus colubriformis TaxID=6319 RepID=A0AAN8FCN4_TRICO
MKAQGTYTVLTSVATEVGKTENATAPSNLFTTLSSKAGHGLQRLSDLHSLPAIGLDTSFPLQSPRLNNGINYARLLGVDQPSPNQ